MSEVPKDKRPPETLIWLGSSEELENWMDRVVSGKEQAKIDLLIPDSEVE